MKKKAWTSEPAMPLEHINFKNGRKCLVTSMLSNHSRLPSLLGKHLSLSEMHCKHLRKKLNAAGLSRIPNKIIIFFVTIVRTPEKVLESQNFDMPPYQTFP